VGKRWQPLLGKPTATPAFVAAGKTQTEGAIERMIRDKLSRIRSDEHTLGLSKELLIVRKLDPCVAG
jgi:hypothetical protein